MSLHNNYQICKSPALFKINRNCVSILLNVLVILTRKFSAEHYISKSSEIGIKRSAELTKLGAVKFVTP